MATNRDIRNIVTELVAQGKELLQRMRSPERLMLNAVDLHVLRAQLQILDDEAANLEHLLSKGHSSEKTGQR
jgi:hypothetical protein